jgi:hypothetical protein
MTFDTGHGACGGQFFLIQDTGFHESVSLLLQIPVTRQAGVVIGRQIIVHIGRVLDVPGRRVGFQLIMTSFGHAAFHLGFSIPVMVAPLTGIVEMGPMGKFHGRPFGIHFLGRSNGQGACGNRHHLDLMDRFGMGFGMTPLTVDGAGVKPFHAGGFLGFEFVAMTVPAGLVIGPGQGLDPFFPHRGGAGRSGPQVFMASGGGTALHLALAIPFMMAVFAGIGKMKGMRKYHR